MQAEGAVEVGIMIKSGPRGGEAADKLGRATEFSRSAEEPSPSTRWPRTVRWPRSPASSDALHPAVLILIGRAAGAVVGAGGWAGVCGELAADPLAVPLLLGLGVRELSVGPGAVATVKEIVRATDLAAAAGWPGRPLTWRPPTPFAISCGAKRSPM